MYHLLALDSTMSPRFFVTQFLLGLRDDLRAAVRLQAPTSITRDSVLARIQEEENDVRRPRPRLVPSGRPPPLPAALPPRPAAVARPPNDDFGRERQLPDYRRANGLCFKCGDRYSRQHRCKQPTQLLTINVGEYGEVLTDDAVHALELLEDPAPVQPAPECCLLSTHAVSGGESPHTICLRALVGNQVMLLLVDSGSTHSFISQAFEDRIKAKSMSSPPVEVRVINGDRLTCDSMVTGVQWWCQGHMFTTDMRQLALGAYDGVLGMDWLEQNGPMNCHWFEKTISFTHQGSPVTLQGVRPKDAPTIEPIEPDQFTKWHAGNNIWYMAVVDWRTPSTDKDKPPPQAVQAVLDNYADVFGEPKSLPPHRQYDHAVTVVDGAQPANGHPYRYSNLQKR